MSAQQENRIVLFYQSSYFCWIVVSCRYMKRLLSDLPKPSVGLNSSEGSQATAVAKLLKEGATFLTHGKSLPEEVAYPGADRRCVRWAEFLKAKKLTAKTL